MATKAKQISTTRKTNKVKPARQTKKSFRVDRGGMDEQLKHLYDYTKFHIGMYTVLIVGIIAVFTNDSLNAAYSSFLPFIHVATTFLIFAAIFGGLIASSVPYHTDFDEFMKSKLGPWDFKWLEAEQCTHLEHACFWLSLLVAALGLMFTAL